MANLGDNFTQNVSPEANFTSEVGDGRASASLDYLDQAMRGFFTRLQDKLSQAGIELPGLDLFDSGNSGDGQTGGDSAIGLGGPAGRPGGSSDEGINCQPGDSEQESEPCEESNESSNSYDDRLPYTRKELGGDLISENKDEFDYNDDGIAQRSEVRAFRDTLAKGSLERKSVNTVLDDFKAVKDFQTISEVKTTDFPTEIWPDSTKT